MKKRETAVLLGLGHGWGLGSAISGKPTLISIQKKRRKGNMEKPVGSVVPRDRIDESLSPDGSFGE